MHKKIGNAIEWLRQEIKWHMPDTVARMEDIEKRFNLDKEEIEWLESCISHHALTEYVVFNEDRSIAWITVEVRNARRLINLRRRAVRRSHR